MDKAYNQVKEFHTACSIAMPKVPTMLKGEVLERSSWMLEELVEFMKAQTIEDQSDALIDLIYFALGTFTLMGVNPQPIFNIVQNANMSKVGQGGKVIRNEQGKIMKPDGWKAPEPLIVKEIERQAKSAECPVCHGESKPIYGLECQICE